MGDSYIPANGISAKLNLGPDSAVGSALGGNEAPVSSSWAQKNNVSSHLALATILSIVLYELLVIFAMQVRQLRLIMNNWLMWVLFGVNMALIVALAVSVYVKKREYSGGR
jgi:hypothetical protein